MTKVYLVVSRYNIYFYENIESSFYLLPRICIFQMIHINKISKK